MSRMFAGNRPLKEIKKAVLEKGWKWDERRYKAGSDYVTFQFYKKEVVYNTFNGGFFVKVGHKVITERSTDKDSVKWYDDLLDFIYLPLEEKAA